MGIELIRITDEEWISMSQVKSVRFDGDKFTFVFGVVYNSTADSLVEFGTDSDAKYTDDIIAQLNFEYGRDKDIKRIRDDKRRTKAALGVSDDVEKAVETSPGKGTVITGTENLG